MNLFDIVREVRRHLEENGRLSLRMLRRQFELDDDGLEEVIEELVDVQGVARRDGKVLAWAGAASPSAAIAATERSQRDETGEHIHEKIAQPDSALAGERKIVTIVFADLAGSTALQERLDAESARVFMQRYYEAMRTAVAAYSGTVAKLLGDGVLAVFGTPRVAEDDAPRAVHAAFEMHRAFRELAEEHTALVGAIGLRVAVNTGEVIASGDAEIVGDPVNVAARLQEQCGNGEVVVGEATHRLVSQLVTLTPLGSLALKGRAGTVKAYRVESLEGPSGVIQAQFVGRDDELARMTAVFENAVSKPATALTVLLGSPGLGKSRLIDEFSDRLTDTAHVVSAHCDEVSSATFAPLVLALRELLEIDSSASADDARAAIEAAIPGEDAERTRIAKGIAALFTGSPTSPEETFFVVRRFFAALATVRPVILVIDDLQWAEPMLLDLIEHLVEWGSNVPMLVLVGARPELRAKRSSLVSPGGGVADVVTLAGLEAGAAMRLAANVIGASDLPAAVAAKVLATSEGNPLFVGELVRMLVHDGALTKEGDRWTAGTALAALEMPPTIHALLAARIERLQRVERIVLERAAVVGRHFSRSAVAELLPRDVVDLDTHIESLQRSELIERDTGWFLGEPVLRFHHVLIRDAAYRQILKGSRAELHSRFADWVQERAGDSVDHDETIGWHLEQAHILLGELGPIDANGRAIGERASKHLAAAGRRALAGDDVSLAASLLGRAIKRLDAKDTARSELALDWCEALLAAGDVATAMEAIDELDRVVGDSARLRAWHTCFAGQYTVLTAPEGREHTANAVAAAAESLASQGDPAGEAKAHFVHALALASLGRIGDCEAALDRALAAARRVAGDRRRANTVLAVAPLAALWGPSPVTRASGRCLDVVRVLRITQGAPAVEAVALSCQGVLEALRGRTDAARRMIASSREMVEELGITQRLLEVDVSSGLVDLLEGDAASAERSLRHAYEGMRELGLGIDAARAAALLARALLALGEVTEAEELSHESEALAGDDLKAAIAWRGVRAEALARRGEHTAAVELATKAVGIAAATDALLDHADARLALAAALRAAGRHREADAEEAHANELWDAKGATLLAERARSDAVASSGLAAREPAAVAPAPVLRRRVRPNRVTACRARSEAALAARDFDTIRAQLSDSHQEIDHTTGATYGPDEGVASLRRLLQSDDPYYEVLPLATLGDSLMIARRCSGASGAVSTRYDVGAYENVAIWVLEVDEHGLMSRTEVFAENHLDEAIARLYARYAELQPEGPARERALATQQSITTLLLASDDIDRMPPLLARDFESVDHRPLRTWSMRGASAYIEHMGALLAVADDIDIRAVDVLALEPNALLIRRLHSGTEHVGGGAYERAFLAMFVADDDGRIARVEWFAEDQAAQALARFEELTASGPTRDRTRSLCVTPNDATRFCQRYDAAITARDLTAIEALLSDHFSIVHHSAGPGYDKEAFVEQWRVAFESERFERRSEVLATLGDSLVLGRDWLNVSGLKAEGFQEFGPAEIHHVFLIETDSAGRGLRADLFPPERPANAIIRLYERYAELLPVGPGRDGAATTARVFAELLGTPPDADILTVIAAPNFELLDRRTLGFGSIRGIDGLRGYLSAYVREEDAELNPREIFALRRDIALLRTVTVGTSRTSGGAYERHMLQLWAFADDGRLARMEQFDSDNEAEALARFDELVGQRTTRSPQERFANAATRLNDNVIRAWRARDWAAIEALHAPGATEDDRRRLVGSGDIPGGILATFSYLFDRPNSSIRLTPIATRGERLALSRVSFEGTVDAEGGALAIDYLVVDEVDANGLSLHVVTLDPDDLDAAYAELDARAAAIGEPVVQAGASPIRTVQAPAATASRKSGDWLAEITTSNAAAIATHRFKVAYDVFADTGDDSQLRSICAPGHAYEDRQRMALLSGDVEMVLASVRERAAIGARLEYRLLGTAGDRIAIGTSLWSGGPPDGRFEIEYFVVIEVNEAGLISALVLMDLDDPRAVQREAWIRWAAIDPDVPGVVTPIGEAVDAFNEQDVAGFRAAHTGDLVVDDHRLAGIGRIEGADAYTESIVALWELAPITQVSNGWLWPAFDACGGVTVLRRTGTLPDGGDFETEYLFLFIVDLGRFAHIELFELHALDEALARFEALRSDPLRIPPNAARRTLTRFARAAEAGGYDALRSLARADFVYEDRGRRALLTGDVETWITSIKYMMEQPGVNVTMPLLATVGDRIQIDKPFFCGNPDDGASFEIERIRLMEVDDDGRLRTSILFDPDDRASAIAEAQDRFLAGEAAGMAAHATIARMFRAWSEKDWGTTRETLAENIAIDDHRPLSFGRIGRDEWIESWRVGVELAPDVAGNWIRLLDWNEHGRVPLIHIYGTREGGKFENVFIGVLVANDNVVTHFEFFTVEDADRALARFRELTSDAAGGGAVSSEFDQGDVAMNAAREATARWHDMFAACAASGDWEPLRSAYAEDGIFEDRQRHALVSGNLGVAFASVRERAAAGARPKITVLATIGERIVITRMLWAGGPAGGRFEVEHLTVSQVDASGVLAATILFDVDDMRAAQREAWERWATIEPAVAPHLALLTKLMDAWNSHDDELLRAPLADDIVVEDHRLAGIGRVEGADAHRRANEVLWDLAPNQRIECGPSLCAYGPHGMLATLKRHGRLPDGGDFESVYLTLFIVKDGLVTGLELFEIDALDQALARFEELRSDRAGR